MKKVDEARLERDPEYRFEYLAEFIGFSAKDHSAIQMAAMYLGPMIPQLVDATYQRLLAYDALAAKFRELKLRRAPDCKYCASLHGAPFPGYIDYAFFCSTAGGDAH